MKLSKDVSQRITMLRPILIFGVVFVHVIGFSEHPSEVGPGVFMAFASFIKNAVFRGTVPTMSLISGFLLFNQGLDRAPLRLLKKKCLTLLVPFVAFSLACYALMTACNRVLGPEVYFGFDQMQKTTGGWSLDRLDVLFGFTVMPLNGPLHFVRDMLVTLLFVPLMSVLIRRAPWAGLLAIGAIFGLDLDGVLILRASSLVLFYIGGVAAVYQWNLLAWDKYAHPCLMLFLVACACLIGFRIDDNTLLVLVAPFLIWPAAALLKGTRIEAWAMKHSKYSFFVFAAHYPFMALAWWFVKVHARWVPFPVYWFVVPVLTILLLKVVFDVAMRVAPNVFNLMIGARARKAPVFVERRKTPRPANAPASTAGEWDLVRSLSGRDFSTAVDVSER